MTYRVRIDPVALGQIEQFATWLSDYSEDFAIEQIERLDEILRLNRSFRFGSVQGIDPTR